MQDEDTPGAAGAQPRTPRIDRAAFRYDGFAAPNFTPIPDDFFDLVAANLSEAELRVLLYLMRRTFGFKKGADSVSLKQLVEGIRKRDGTVLDLGTGMSKSSVVRGLAGLEEKGLIVAHRNASAEKGDLPTTYGVRMRGDAPRVAQSDTGSSASGTGRVALPDTPRVALPDPQETGSQETVGQETAVEASRIRGSAGPVSERYDDARLALLPYVEDLAGEMNDQAPLAATTTRVVNLYRASGLDLDAFIDQLLRARAITKERTAAIRGRSDAPAGRGAKPKMAYLLAVLADLTGPRDG